MDILNRICDWVLDNSPDDECEERFAKILPLLLLGSAGEPRRQ